MSDAPAALDCQSCAACCRGAFESVSISAQEAVIELHPQLVRFREGRFELARHGDRCAALETRGDGHACRIYEDRPSSCRAFEAGGERCLAARERVGLGARGEPS